MFNKSANESDTRRHTPSTDAELPRRADHSAAAHSLIGSATLVVGDVIGDEDLRIEGRVEGNVKCCRHSVSIGSRGQIEGDLCADTLSVAGRVKGRLIAVRRITIHAGADVEGELHTPGLILEDGAAFHGTVDMNADNPVLDEVTGETDSQGPLDDQPAAVSPLQALDDGDEAAHLDQRRE